ncbi:DUF3593 domain-containing protein [Chlorobium sp. BLA1]|uniref:DUF3593 domain-containing protein n=1 Tax=Candidatus Chlorobium masyuteum TaxID=2716876 RepID=UPI00141F8025|nr:DUF3593 domain-containing protein [Candidatus Chlorobium masyuteum]NHQ59602.1 DUF3593 domain-containing protein [Candidatus Chlorobium masyuteum]
MLLSFPNWIIHLSSALEWGLGAALLFRYGRLCNRRDIRIFALSMLPHWSGSFFVLGYHVSGDSVPLLLDLSEIINLFGSISLLLATLNLLKSTKKAPSLGFAAALGAIIISGKPQSYLGEDIFDTILQLSSVVYISFLVLLFLVYRRDRTIFSGLTVAGFWFVLVFISVTIFCMYLATVVRGFPTLSHDDLLHGMAESLLTISNLMIAIGAHRKIREYETNLAGSGQG